MMRKLSTFDADIVRPTTPNVDMGDAYRHFKMSPGEFIGTFLVDTPLFTKQIELIDSLALPYDRKLVTKFDGQVRYKVLV